MIKIIKTTLKTPIEIDYESTVKSYRHQGESGRATSSTEHKGM